MCDRYEVPIRSRALSPSPTDPREIVTLDVDFKNVNGKLACRNGSIPLAPDEELNDIEIYTESRASEPWIEGHLFVMCYDQNGAETGWTELYADDPNATNRGFRCTTDDATLFPNTERDIRRRFITSTTVFQSVPGLPGTYVPRKIITSAGRMKVRLSYVSPGAPFTLWQNLVQVVRNDDNPHSSTGGGGEIERLSVTPSGETWGADYNLDSSVTVDDTMNFVTDWAEQAPLSDLNGDGLIDAADLALFAQLTNGQ